MTLLYNIVIMSTIFILLNLTYNLACSVDEAVVIIFTFRPLWETMRKHEITQYHLLKEGIDNKTLDSLKKNKNITIATLEKLCKIIGCTPNDIVEFE